MRIFVQLICVCVYSTTVHRGYCAINHSIINKYHLDDSREEESDKVHSALTDAGRKAQRIYSCWQAAEVKCVFISVQLFAEYLMSSVRCWHASFVSAANGNQSFCYRGPPRRTQERTRGSSGKIASGRRLLPSASIFQFQRVKSQIIYLYVERQCFNILSRRLQ